MHFLARIFWQRLNLLCYSFLLSLLICFQSVNAQTGNAPATPSANPASAATNANAQTATWQRYSMSDEGFNVSFPEQPIVFVTSRPTLKQFEEPPKVIVYSAYADGVVYVVASFAKRSPTEDAKDILPEIGAYIGIVRGEEMEARTINKFVRRRYRIVNALGAKVGIADGWTTPERIYFVRLVGMDENNSAAAKFLDSFAVKSRNASSSKSGREVDQTAREVKAETFVDVAVTPSPTQTETQVYRASEVTGEQSDGQVRRAQIVLKLSPGYTDDARRNQTSGTVRLRAVLSSDGHVRSIAAVKRLPDGLTEKAVVAARAIRFIPAIKDGRYVSQYVTLEYSFTLY